MQRRLQLMAPGCNEFFRRREKVQVMALTMLEIKVRKRRAAGQIELFLTRHSAHALEDGSLNSSQDVQGIRPKRPGCPGGGIVQFVERSVAVGDARSGARGG